MCCAIAEPRWTHTTVIPSAARDLLSTRRFCDLAKEKQVPRCARDDRQRAFARRVAVRALPRERCLRTRADIRPTERRVLLSTYWYRCRAIARRRAYRHWHTRAIRFHRRVYASAHSHRSRSERCRKRRTSKTVSQRIRRPTPNLPPRLRREGSRAREVARRANAPIAAQKRPDSFPRLRPVRLEIASNGTNNRTGSSSAMPRVAPQSPNVNNDAFPPAAVVFTVTVFSVAKRGR